MAERFLYEDILHLPPHMSKKHPQPTLSERAARFAPFAAIVGYEEMVMEEARETADRIELDESALADLNERLNMIRDALETELQIRITYFEPDKRKSGGAYITVTGIIKRIDEYERLILMTDGKKIPIDLLYGLESPLFDRIS